ncbi:MAG: protein kinase domain-containing protein [Anaerolineales bacterium]
MIGKTLNDRYRIESEIGLGGMGIVYRGYDTTLERQIAIKVLSRSELGTEGSGKLINEAQTAAQLNHPNIVTVYDVGEEDGIPFIVMEYVEGRTLHDQIPESLEEALAILRQVCAGLEHAHGRGIIHRDLKPENVMITPDGTAKLMDFGLARSVASRFTTDGTVAGTVFYLAPEQALGEEIDPRSDLYSLGVMAYELTTGELPFVDLDPIAVISQHLHAPVVPPRAKNEDIPRVVNELILDLMNKDRRDRPSSAREVLHRLGAIELGGIESEQVEEFSLLDRIVRGRMVGRERELSQARQLWQNAKSGEGQLLLISGEPGIGKTRLMREIATQAEVSGGQVYIGECQAEGNAPYAPFAQITRRALRENKGNGFVFPKHVLADLLVLSPELRVEYPQVELNPKLDPEAEQRRLFENVLRFCDILSSDEPLLLVLEDIHWADSGSLRMLENLAQRVRQMPIMLVGTYRELELDEALPLHETLLGLTRKRLGRRVKLERLSREATRDMLGVIFAEEITQEFLGGIYKETEGNPFFVEEVSKALVESGQVWFEAGEWHRIPDMAQMTIPQGIRVAIQSRVSKLSGETQGILLTAAVIGREFDYDTLKKVTEMEDNQLISCLEEAISKQLIEEMKQRGGEQFLFSHALIPGAIRENISGLRRTRLHRQVAAAIEELHPEEFERLAYHWGEAGDEERGLDYTIKAAERAQQAYANDDAVRLYSEALALLPEDHPQRFDLLAGRAAVYDVTAKRVSQMGDISAMVDLAEKQGDKGKQADALMALGSLYSETEISKAQEPLEQALEFAQESGDAVREGRALYCLGRQAYFVFDYYKAKDCFEASADQLQKAGLIGESAESLSFLSVTLGFLGDHSAALEAAQEAVVLSKKTGDRLLEALSTRRLAIAFLNEHQNSLALPLAESALKMFKEIGDIPNEVHALNVLAILKNRMGQVEQAEADFLEGMKIAGAINNDVGILWLVGNLGSVYNWNMGEYSKYLSLIEDQENKARQNENESLILYLQAQELTQLMKLGRYDTAYAVLEAILPSINDVNEISQGWALRGMALLCAELDKDKLAYMYLDQAEKLCERTQNPFERASLEIVAAYIILVLGERSKLPMGVEKINSQTPFLRQRGFKFDLGDAMYIKGRLHLELFEQDRSQAGVALECIQEALECYQIESNWIIMPEQVHFQHSRALWANGLEQEADKALQKAYGRMRMVAGNIKDDELRRSYLENVRDNRELQAAYHERFG